MYERPMPCAVDLDPLFDPRSLRRDYYDLHSVTVDLEDREPIKGVNLMVSYRASVQYSDAGDVKIGLIELLEHRTLEDGDRGRPTKTRPTSTLTPAEYGILTLLRADAGSESGLIEINSVIAAHQAERDTDDFDF